MIAVSWSGFVKLTLFAYLNWLDKQLLWVTLNIIIRSRVTQFE